MREVRLVIAKLMSERRVVLGLMSAVYLLRIDVYFFQLISLKVEGEEEVIEESENSRRMVLWSEKSLFRLGLVKLG